MTVGWVEIPALALAWGVLGLDPAYARTGHRAVATRDFCRVGTPVPTKPLNMPPFRDVTRWWAPGAHPTTLFF